MYLHVNTNRSNGEIAAWKTRTQRTVEWVFSTETLVLDLRSMSYHVTILHSDHGRQEASDASSESLLRNVLKINMGQVRTCANKVSADSVFVLLKRELVNRHPIRTWIEAGDGSKSTS